MNYLDIKLSTMNLLSSLYDLIFKTTYSNSSCTSSGLMNYDYLEIIFKDYPKSFIEKCQNANIEFEIFEKISLNNSNVEVKFKKVIHKGVLAFNYEIKKWSK